MTREQYESLPLSELREIAKVRQIRGVSALRKEALIERLLSEDEAEDSSSVQQNEAYERRENEANSAYGTKRSGNYTGRRTYDAGTTSGRRGYDSHPTTGGIRRPYEHDAASSGYGQRSGHYNSRTNERELHEPSRAPQADFTNLDSGVEARGILEVLPDGYGFMRSDNFMPGDEDVYVSPSQIRKFGLKTGDIICGNTRLRTQNEKFSALLFIKSVNGLDPEKIAKRPNFEDMTPIFPNKRIRLERAGGGLSMRLVDLISPIGKGQRGLIVSPPKAGKTTLLKGTAKSILENNPEMHMIILLIDERPEEVTDIKQMVEGSNVEVIYSTFDEVPDHHRRVAEMVISRAKRLVEQGMDVIIFIDSITRLARAYNVTIPPSGRTLSGGLDPAALHQPKRFFGAARNVADGGSLTILATALVDTGSKMDDMIYEEFKGTGNMELVLDRRLQERRVFPAVDLLKSSTRREDLLLSEEEQEAVNIIRRSMYSVKSDEATETLLNLFAHTRSNDELVQQIRKRKFL